MQSLFRAPVCFRQWRTSPYGVDATGGNMPSRFLAYRVTFGLPSMLPVLSSLRIPSVWLYVSQTNATSGAHSKRTIRLMFAAMHAISS
jgi:hypothetical protein